MREDGRGDKALGVDKDDLGVPDQGLFQRRTLPAWCPANMRTGQGEAWGGWAWLPVWEEQCLAQKGYQWQCHLPCEPDLAQALTLPPAAGTRGCPGSDHPGPACLASPASSWASASPAMRWALAVLCSASPGGCKSEI